MELEQLVEIATKRTGQPGAVELIRLFAWHLHTYAGKTEFRTADISRYFDRIHIHRPNSSQLLTDLANRRLLIKSGRSYRLAKQQRDLLDAKYGQREETTTIDKILSGLPTRISDVSCQEYLREGLICFRHKAFRAAMLMAWNVTYGQLTSVIVVNHLLKFNSQMSGMFGGRKRPVAAVEDFQRLKESETIEVCNAAGIVSKEMAKVLLEKLDKRNTVAHPSGAVVDKLQAEAFISDLVQNAFMRLA